MGCFKLSYYDHHQELKEISLFPEGVRHSRQAQTQKIGINYSTFGMLLPGRHGSEENYRHGFNGMEKDDEIKGSGNSYDFGARMYDPRIGRWLSLDPKATKYPNQSPYSFSANSPIFLKDVDGKEYIVTITQDPKGNYAIQIQATFYLTGRGSSDELHAKLNELTSQYYPAGQETILEKDNAGNIVERSVSISFDITFVDAHPFGGEVLEDPNMKDKRVQVFGKMTDKSFSTKDNKVLAGLDLNDAMLDGTNVLHVYDPSFQKEIRSSAYMDYAWGIVGPGTVDEMAQTAFHEIGHLMGLEDKYTDIKNSAGKTIGSKPLVDKGTGQSWKGDVMAGGDQFNPMHYKAIASFWVGKFNQRTDKSSNTMTENSTEMMEKRPGE